MVPGPFVGQGGLRNNEREYGLHGYGVVECLFLQKAIVVGNLTRRTAQEDQLASYSWMRVHLSGFGCHDMSGQAVRECMAETMGRIR